MKFSNGYWLTRPGVTVYPCAQTRDTRVGARGVTLHIAPMRVSHKGQTLGGPLFELTFSSCLEGSLQVTLRHYIGGAEVFPRGFALCGGERAIGCEDKGEEVIITSGSLSAVVRKDAFCVEYYHNGRFLTASDPKQLAYLTAPDGPYCRERLRVSVGEDIYGFGERFTPFVKNGQVVDIWNEDGGTASEQAYKNVPFCVSSSGYGVFVNHTEAVSFEVCSEAVSKLSFSVRGEELRYMIIGGEDMREVISRYTDITGKPALPPAWSFGLWLSTSFTTDYDEGTVNTFTDGMASRGIPLSVFHFDCFWMKEYRWCDFTWDADIFPDPPGMLSRLKQKGLRICVWINPYIGQRSPLFAQAAQHGYLLKTKDGNVWQCDAWQPGMGIVDFTNPDAALWYQSHLRRLMGEGVDCFKTDFGERIPTDCAYHSGACPERMHNYYAYLYNKAVFDVVKAERGEGEAVVFARSATAGCQRFPVHWGGDCEATYESMAETLRGGLSLALAGFGFWSHDIGGFEQTAAPDLYKRWVAFGLFSTHSRLHGNSSYRVPWLFDEEASEVLKFFAVWKCRLMPYIYSQAALSRRTGLPVMRPMVLEFGSDPVCRRLDRQYMLGESILVAPIFNPQGMAEYYLPEGVWTHLFTGEGRQGGRYYRERHDYFSLPVYVRENSLVAAGRGDTAAYDYHVNPVITAYEARDAAAALTDSSGRERFTVRAARVGAALKVTARGEHGGFTVRLARAPGGELVFAPGQTEAELPL
ncbi:MAG: alpha-xylosidase [Oscillospiraceae bacterium]|jgi:alpha-D-xyloside xylohydrolase|nr:alpha-xylosidase [Oscillospiraceae bacterium]